MIGQGSAMETIRIKQRIFYPFNRNFDAFDLMMLKLNHTSIKPILKLRPNVTEGKTFGTIGLGQEITSDLQEVEFEYTDNDKCQEKHGWQYDIIGSHICAESSKDSCFFGGKGGSPLFIKGGSYEEDELVGVLIGAVYT